MMGRIKIGDLLLILAALVFVFVFAGRYFTGIAGDELVRVTGPDTSEVFPLHQDRTIDVRGPLGVTKVVVRGGAAWIDQSPCREKICMKMGTVRRAGEQVVCVPNGVVVEIEGARGYIDGVSR
jgi:hypothetical protein